MKKLLPSALLALAVSGFAAAESFAGAFGLFPHCGCCGCGAKFCVRQYNAFSPVCCGTVFCDGCCPFGSGCGPNFGGGGGGPCAGGMCPGGGGGLNYMGVMGCPPGGCDGGCLGSLPPTEGAPVSDAAQPPTNPIMSPSPLPSQMPAGATSQVANYRPIQNASYRSVSYPVPSVVLPAAMQARPQIMAAPSYWSE